MKLRGPEVAGHRAADGRVRRVLLIFALLYFIGAAINVPLAVSFLRSRLGAPRTCTELVRGDEAAARGWPSKPPAGKPWPPPDYYWVHRAFGYRNLDVRADLPEINDRLTMDLKLMGWPLPVLYGKHMWWPDTPVTWSFEEPDPAIGLHWPGVVINPLLFAVGGWLVLFGAPALARSLRRRRRIRRSLCPQCAYPMGESPNCSECGCALPMSESSAGLA